MTVDQEKDTYEKELSARIAAWNERLDQLSDEDAKGSANQSEEVQKYVEQLRKRKRHLDRRLDQLRKAPDFEEWMRAREELDQAAIEFAQAMSRTPGHQKYPSEA